MYVCIDYSSTGTLYVSLIGLDQVSRKLLKTAGGKGANLGELIQQGFPIPPGFVVTAQEYAVFLDGLDIPANKDIPEDTEAFLAAIRTKILATPLDESLLVGHKRHHEILTATRSSHLVYAVRSSATAKDLADASFAGQHDTYCHRWSRCLFLLFQIVSISPGL